MRAPALMALLFTAAAPWPAVAQDAPGDSIQARVWLDRGDDPVVQRGDQVRVYYRTSQDAYAAIFRIDTDGVVRMIFPQHPDATEAVTGGRDYRLLFPSSPRWEVEEDPGVGYFFMVASPEPLDFSLLGYDVEAGWDLSGLGEVVYKDPYVAIDDYVAAVVPGWEFVPFALDFVTYNVGDTHTYPRFLCYDCHDYKPYGSWDPYLYDCTSFSVVVWDDPYFYPQYRYSGTRVVFARPLRPRPRYEVVTRVTGVGRYPIVRTREAPPRRVAEYKESPRPASYAPRNPVRRSPSSALQARPGAPPRQAPAREPAARRGGGVTSPTTGGRQASPRAVPGTGVTVRGVPAPGATAAPPPTDTRPTLQRRPTSNATTPSRVAPGRRPPESRSTEPARARGVPVRRDPPAVGRGAVPSRGPTGAAPGRPTTSGRAPSAGSSTPTRPGAAARPAPSRGASPPATARPPVRPPTGRGGPPPRRPGGS